MTDLRTLEIFATMATSFNTPMKCLQHTTNTQKILQLTALSVVREYMPIETVTGIAIALITTVKLTTVYSASH